MPEGLKKVKDFNDEEKAAIAARAKKSELSRIAKDFGTTWQVVSAIAKAAAKPKVKPKTKTNAKPKAAAKKKPAKKPAAAPKKAARSNNERRLEILKRASEIGVTKAAAEAGVSKWTVFQWRKIMKKEGYVLPPVAKGRSRKNAAAAVSTPKSTAKSTAKTKAPASKAKAAAPKVTATKTAPKNTAKPSGSYSSLELENQILKQKLATLTEQVEKLRAAIAKLA